MFTTSLLGQTAALSHSALNFDFDPILVIGRGKGLISAAVEQLQASTQLTAACL